LKEYVLSYNQQFVQQLSPKNYHNLTNKKATMIITGLTRHMEDVAKDTEEDTRATTEDIKGPARRNATSVGKLDVGQINTL
jgi:hypothetical protein